MNSDLESIRPGSLAAAIRARFTRYGDVDLTPLPKEPIRVFDIASRQTPASTGRSGSHRLSE
jgi:hypothetical protein